MASFFEEMRLLPGELFDALEAPTVTITRTRQLPRTDAERDAGEAAREETSTITTRGIRMNRKVKADDGVSTTETVASVLGEVMIDDQIKFAAGDRIYTASSVEEIAPDGGMPSMCRVVLR